MIGIAMVGTGMVAETHIKALHDLAEQVRIIGVHARNRETLDGFCRQHNVPTAYDFDALIASPDVDVLLLLTPPNARLDFVRKAVSAGKHVLMEKPVERTTAAAAEIVAMVEDAGLRLGVIFQHRYRAASQALTTLVNDGGLGKLCAAQVAVPWWRPQSYYDVAGRGTYARDGGGVLISQAIHTLDLMQVFTGPVESVMAIAATTSLHHMEAEDFVAGGLAFASGAVGSLVATTASYPGEPESIVLNFENASAQLRSGILTVNYLDGRTETFGQTSSTGGGADPMAFTHDWHRSAIEDFVDAIATERPTPVSGRAALETHRLIDALIRSARESRRVSLSEI